MAHRVAIVGAGYTGLWTAYYLKLAEPSLDIAVLEARFAGAWAAGAAFVAGTGAQAVVVGHDMRASSPGMARAFADGVLAARMVDRVYDSCFGGARLPTSGCDGASTWCSSGRACARVCVCEA